MYMCIRCECLVVEIHNGNVHCADVTINVPTSIYFISYIRAP